MIANEGGAITCKPNVPSSTDTLTQRMRSAVTSTGGSKIWNISLTVAILRSNLTGAGNAITEPVVKWAEGVCEVRGQPKRRCAIITTGVRQSTLFL